MNVINVLKNCERTFLGPNLEVTWAAPYFNVSNFLRIKSPPLVCEIGAKLVSNWEQKLASFRQKKDIYVNRLIIVILGMQVCILQTRT